LSLGRESLLFQWNERALDFKDVFKIPRVLGITPAAALSYFIVTPRLLSVIAQMRQRGTVFRLLAAVTENILCRPTQYGSIAVTFVQCVVSLTQSWQSQRIILPPQTKLPFPTISIPENRCSFIGAWAVMSLRTFPSSSLT
jgi:hypothetical protein